MSNKLQGTVKWFSNKKGYGFITPAEGSSASEDIFVHQSVIHCEGYRTLDEGWAVEFSIGRDEDGKVKAEDVTAPGGGPCTGPRSSRRRREGRRDGAEPVEVEKEELVGDNAPTEKVDIKRGTPHRAPRGRNSRDGNKANGERAPTQPFWHEILSPDVKSTLDAKGIRTSTRTIDIAYGPARIKLGTRGYSSMAHADGILCEGLFSCTPSGEATFQWKNAMKFDREWKKISDMSFLLSKLFLNDDSVAAVGKDETAVSLWGNGPTNPKNALEANGFDMRRVVLTSQR